MAMTSASFAGFCVGGVVIAVLIQVCVVERIGSREQTFSEKCLGGIFTPLSGGRCFLDISSPPLTLRAARLPTLSKDVRILKQKPQRHSDHSFFAEKLRIQPMHSHPHEMPMPPWSSV